MALKLEPARLAFCAYDTPFSEVYDDVYHAVAGAHAQARHVFLGGNRLPERWQGKETFVILETGFGLGLSFLATCLAWLDDPFRSESLHYISLEKHPFSAEDLAVVHAAWPDFSEISEELRRKWPALESGEHRLELAAGRIVLRLLLGDVREQLPVLNAEVDAFYLDGFSPAKNPEMWSPDLCRLLAQRAASGATLATWTVAGSVRRALLSAGFIVSKQAGTGHKRTMLTGYCPALQLNCSSL
ncbi:MAG: tRNA (5-methylaminomethyl-2-thiouridine)(34)-methyltransferase MnmD [Betaproteobacteria bacterium]